MRGFTCTILSCTFRRVRSLPLDSLRPALRPLLEPGLDSGCPSSDSCLHTVHCALRHKPRIACAIARHLDSNTVSLWPRGPSGHLPGLSEPFDASWFAWSPHRHRSSRSVSDRVAGLPHPLLVSPAPKRRRCPAPLPIVFQTGSSLGFHPSEVSLRPRRRTLSGRAVPPAVTRPELPRDEPTSRI